MGWQDRAYNREYNGGIPPVRFSFPKISPLAMVIIAGCLVIYLVQAFTRGQGSPLEEWGRLTFYDSMAFSQPWRWVTYQYLHGSGLHLIFNMLGVYFFLPSLELRWGWQRALVFYTLGGIAAGVTYGLLVAMVPGAAFGGLIGASGSVLATLGAVALFYPERQLVLLFFLVPIRVAAGLLGVVYLLTTVADQDLSNAAHLGGLAFGFFAPWLAGPQLARAQRGFSKWQTERARTSQRDELLQVDAILQKVHDKGMNSLTRSERNVLKRATERQRTPGEKSWR